MRVRFSDEALSKLRAIHAYIAKLFALLDFDNNGELIARQISTPVKGLLLGIVYFRIRKFNGNGNSIAQGCPEHFAGLYLTFMSTRATGLAISGSGIS